MNSNKLLQYIEGYVDIVVEGYYIERFINICSNKQIDLWNLKRIDSITINASIKISEFRKLKQICKKTKCKVKIKNKKGLPFLVRKYKKRKVFIGFLLLIIIVIISLSNFVWNIEVEGTTSINPQEIINIAKEEGLDIGKLKGSIDTKKVINQIRLKRDDVAWAGIEIKGTNVKIKIAEADKKPEIIDESEFCNIVADKDGIISKVSARNGTPLVKQGDVVKKGDIIIAGWLEGKYTDKQYVHSQGEVTAKVYYTSTQNVELKEVQKIETGNIDKSYAIKVNNFQINLPKTLPKFKKYDTIETNKKLKLFSDFYLPIEIVEKEYKEYEETTIIHSIEEAKQIGIDRAAEQLQENLKDKKITNKEVKVKSEPNSVEVEVIYEVEEKIGIEEKIVF